MPAPLPSRFVLAPLALGALALGLVACGDDDRPAESDAGSDDGGGSDAAAPDAGRSCACAPGAHQRLVYLMSDEGELWSWDPSSGEFAFVVGPVCGGATPYSMAVDERGLAWVLFVDSMALQTFDVNDPGPCELSPYVRRNPAFGLFGTSFVARSETDACSDLYVQTYDGEGPFEEGPGLGQLGVIDPISGELEALGVLDYDGGELTGTGDGRLFAFTGTDSGIDPPRGVSL